MTNLLSTFTNWLLPFPICFCRNKFAFTISNLLLGPCTVRPNVIFIFCTFQHLSKQEIFNVLVLLSSSNYFYLKQTSCCEVYFYFLCFKKKVWLLNKNKKKLQNRVCEKRKSKNVNVFIVFQDNLSNLWHEKVTKTPKHDFEAFFVFSKRYLPGEYMTGEIQEHRHKSIF